MCCVLEFHTIYLSTTLPLSHGIEFLAVFVRKTYVTKSAAGIRDLTDAISNVAVIFLRSGAIHIMRGVSMLPAFSGMLSALRPFNECFRASQRSGTPPIYIEGFPVVG